MKHVQFAETFVAEPYKDWTNTIPDVFPGKLLHFSLLLQGRG